MRLRPNERQSFNEIELWDILKRNDTSIIEIPQTKGKAKQTNNQNFGSTNGQEVSKSSDRYQILDVRILENICHDKNQENKHTKPGTIKLCKHIYL